MSSLMSRGPHAVGQHKRKDRPEGGMYVNETETSLTIGSPDQTKIVAGFRRERVGQYTEDQTSSALCHVDHKSPADLVMPASFYGQMKAESQCYREDGTCNTLVNGTNPGHQHHVMTPITHAAPVAPSVTGSGTPYSRVGFNGEHEAIVVAPVIRRLTPVECLHLQGFPSDYFEDVPGYSDTQAYKAIGNSIAVPCVEWIFRRILEFDNDHAG